MKKPSLFKLSTATKIFIVLSLIYAGLVFLLPVNSASQASLGLSNMNYALLLFTLRLPVIIMLALIFYAYRCMHRYSQSITDTPEGAHFASLTKGLAFMVWGLLAGSMISASVSAIANTDPSFRSTSLIIVNYVYVVITLFAFSYISTGVHRLIRQSDVMFTTRHLRLLMAVLVFFGVLFCFFISGRLQGSEPFNSYNAYYLPNILVWGTIVIPYLYAWFLGLFAAFELMLVARHTPGIIYKRALQYLAVGLVTFIIAMVVLQYFRSVIPRTGKLTLGSTLIFSYVIYLFGGAGSLIIAGGAKRLHKIEEV